MLKLHLTVDQAMKNYVESKFKSDYAAALEEMKNKPKKPKKVKVSS